MHKVLSAQLVSESAIVVTVADHIALTNIALLQALINTIKTQMADAFIEAVPSYTTVLVVFNPQLLAPLKALHGVQTLSFSLEECEAKESIIKTIPVYYDKTVAADLEAVAAQLNGTVEDVIQLHSSRIYHVYALGFSPGFAFMGEIDPALVLPRRATPRAKVPKGSVAIAEKQTAVYPQATPGGWHIIGRSPIKFFNAKNNPPAFLNVADQVQFEPIHRSTFIALGGVLDE